MTHSTTAILQEAPVQKINKTPKKRSKPSFLKKNIYKWHKIIGIITVIPLILWTFSGLLLPIGKLLKPEIANTFIIPTPIDQSKLIIPLEDIITQNTLSLDNSIQNFRFINFGNKQYYQIKDTQNNVLYFDTQTGTKLENGDKIYAEHLARYFLGDQKSTIKSITLIEEFETEYRAHSRFLPVWRVSFQRSDNMDMYVETLSDRLGTFSGTTQKGISWAFSLFHNWSFLEMITNEWVRLTVLLLALGITAFSTLSGIILYGFMWKFLKRPKKETQKGVLRRYHRQIGLATALVTFAFTFSAAYHAFRKYEPKVASTIKKEATFVPSTFKTKLKDLEIDWNKTTNVSLVEMNNKTYYQSIQKGEKSEKGQKNAVPTIIYTDTQTGEMVKNGDVEYANYLAMYFTENFYPNLKGEVIKENIAKTQVLSKFSREYGMMSKRLPVVQLDYTTSQKATFYIETTTSTLASKIENADRREKLSFAVLHHFTFLDFAGRNARDIAMFLSTLAILIVSVLGLAIFLKK